MRFEIGVGNGDAFDILDMKESERLMSRVEKRGPFSTLDLAVQAHFTIDDNHLHKIHKDLYIVRLVFQHGRLEMLIHHVKGLRRVGSAEVIELIREGLNAELVREGLPSLEDASVNSS